MPYKRTPLVVTLALLAASVVYAGVLGVRDHAADTAFETLCTEKLKGAAFKTWNQRLCVRPDAILETESFRSW